jgi:hypothetical protein
MDKSCAVEQRPNYWIVRAATRLPKPFRERFRIAAHYDRTQVLDVIDR